jgi:hypothetical protein
MGCLAGNISGTIEQLVFCPVVLDCAWQQISTRCAPQGRQEYNTTCDRSRNSQILSNPADVQRGRKRAVYGFCVTESLCCSLILAEGRFLPTYF